MNDILTILPLAVIPSLVDVSSVSKRLTETGLTFAFSVVNAADGSVLIVGAETNETSETVDIVIRAGKSHKQMLDLGLT